ncbi:hypothetical protein F5B22DRAFT_441056 [Xylaria bambusicola]|uniref:uncharacterized protein n=1 Tax=Xylaria bambusicola TaxID=326684 RepID=UPI00200787AC|nr:uncharacterized protein F5B22DRAFT_441056 [Xylaria bambusicola]KAI0506711.1 hypothetical protein F5B22DRAFT_441056 [Xylaria bambusicola]
MDHPSLPTSDISLPMDRNALHTNEHILSNLEGSTDRRTKKRIQNRVAQRTYRTRIKQRLHDLQQQVQQLQQKEGEQQHITRPRDVETDDSGNEGVAYFTSFNQTPDTAPVRGHRREPSSLGVTSQDVSGIKSMSSDGWTGIPGQSHMWNSGTGFVYSPMPVRTRPPLDLSSETTVGPISPPKLPLDFSNNVIYHSTCHREAPPDALAFSRGDDNSQHQIHNRIENIYEMGEHGKLCHSQDFNSPHLSPWNHILEPKGTSDASIATTRHIPNTTDAGSYPDGTPNAPPQWAGTWLQSHQKTMEEQFEYILSCAQRVGFDSFDTMALHYYTQSFHPASAVSLEQRLSRNHRLPELLEELKKQSTKWSPLQRRGYQDATLKAAEEMCALECSEFQRAEINDNVKEAAMCAMLPNLWALLTGLVSSNPQLSQQQVSEAVSMSMRILCGIDGPQNQSARSSRQSPT